MVESIGNEVSEIWVRVGWRGRLLGAMKEGVDVASAHLCGLFMAVEVVLLKGKGIRRGMELKRERKEDVPGADVRRAGGR